MSGRGQACQDMSRQRALADKPLEMHGQTADHLWSHTASAVQSGTQEPPGYLNHPEPTFLPEEPCPHKTFPPPDPQTPFTPADSLCFTGPPSLSLAYLCPGVLPESRLAHKGPDQCLGVAPSFRALHLLGSYTTHVVHKSGRGTTCHWCVTSCIPPRHKLTSQPQGH